MKYAIIALALVAGLSIGAAPPQLHRSPVNGVCDAGYYRYGCEECGELVGCILCPENTYSARGAVKCEVCAVGKVSDAGSVSVAACHFAVCEAGSTMTKIGCAKCPKNSFAEQGADACTECPYKQVSPAGSTSQWYCHYAPCPGGMYMTEYHGCQHCPHNTYSTEASDKCLACPKGLLSGAGNAALKNCHHAPCHAGYHMTQDGCEICPADYYSYPRKAECSKCPKDMASDKGSTNLFACKLKACLAGQYRLSGSCTECPPNTYSKPGTPDCEVCPLGLESAAGSTGVERCMHVCLAGTFFNSVSKKCDVCPENTFSQAGAKYCTPCTAHKHSPKGSTSEFYCEYDDCAAGEYMTPRDGCNDCPVNTWSAAAAVKCVSCPVGKISNTGAQKEDCYWAPCAAGSSMTPKGCVECPANTYSLDASPVCTMCPESMISKPGSGQYADCHYAPCLAGRFMTRFGCKLCPDNTFSLAGANTCSICPTGQISFSGATSVDECYYDNCHSGSYMTLSGCKICPVNTYSDEGAKSCMRCPAHMVSAAGSTSVFNCRCASAGTYQTPEGCQPCPLNTYAELGAVVCSACPKGKITWEGAVSLASCHYPRCLAGQFLGPKDVGCIACPANFYSYGDKCLACNAGMLSPAGSQAPDACYYAPCIAGFFMTCNGCKQCPENTFSGPGADLCVVCDKHYYSPAGSVVKADCEYKYCPAGRFLHAKSGECDICPANYYSNGGADECSPCPHKRLSLAGSASHFACYYEPCLAGHRMTSLGCVDCPKNFYSLAAADKCENCPSGLISSAVSPALSSCHVEACPAGQFMTKDHKCVPCPASSWSHKGAKLHCTACAAGKEAPGSSVDVVACTWIPCKAGNFLTAKGCRQCPANSWSHAGATECVKCAKAKESPAGSEDIKACAWIPCKAGNFLDVKSGCKQCPANSYSQDAATECVHCAKAKESPAGSKDLNACTWIACTAGNFLDAKLGCQICPANSWSQAAATKCIQCGKAKQSQAGSKFIGACVWTPCTAGSFLDNIMGCQICPANSWSAFGAHECVQCAAAKESLARSVSVQACTWIACLGGNYMTHEGCEVCPAGTWAKAGANECKHCGLGMDSPKGSTASSFCSYIPCVAGKYMTKQGCAVCPINTYAAAKSDKCSDCPAGQHAPTGSADIQFCAFEPCFAGDYMLEGKGCKVCKRNTWSHDAAKKCVDCPAGEKSPSQSSDSSFCAFEPCKGGFYMTASGCKSCPIDTWSEDEAEKCTKCPDGMSSPAESSGEMFCAQSSCKAGSHMVRGSCKLCPANSFSLDGDDDCTKCGPATVSAAGSKSRDACMCFTKQPGTILQGNTSGGWNKLPDRKLACSQEPKCNGIICKGRMCKLFVGSITGTAVTKPDKAWVSYSSGCGADACTAGQIYKDGQCKQCPRDTYSLKGAASCTACAAGSVAAIGSASPDSCLCMTKHTDTRFDPFNGLTKGSWKRFDAAAVECSVNKKCTGVACKNPRTCILFTGSTEKTAVNKKWNSFSVGCNNACPAGQFKVGNQCDQCPYNTYSKSGASVCTKCAKGSVSIKGSTSVDACQCYTQHVGSMFVGRQMAGLWKPIEKIMRECAGNKACTGLACKEAKKGNDLVCRRFEGDAKAMAKDAKYNSFAVGCGGDCPAGQFAASGSVCAHCPIDTYSVAPGAQTCTSCAKGSVSVLGSSSPDACMCFTAHVGVLYAGHTVGPWKTLRDRELACSDDKKCTGIVCKAESNQCRIYNGDHSVAQKGAKVQSHYNSYSVGCAAGDGNLSVKLSQTQYDDYKAKGFFDGISLPSSANGEGLWILSFSQAQYKSYQLNISNYSVSEDDFNVSDFAFAKSGAGYSLTLHKGQYRRYNKLGFFKNMGAAKQYKSGDYRLYLSVDQYQKFQLYLAIYKATLREARMKKVGSGRFKLRKGINASSANFGDFFMADGVYQLKLSKAQYEYYSTSVAHKDLKLSAKMNPDGYYIVSLSNAQYEGFQAIQSKIRQLKVNRESKVGFGQAKSGKSDKSSSSALVEAGYKIEMVAPQYAYLLKLGIFKKLGVSPVLIGSRYTMTLSGSQYKQFGALQKQASEQSKGFTISMDAASYKMMLGQGAFKGLKYENSESGGKMSLKFSAAEYAKFKAMQGDKSQSSGSLSSGGKMELDEGQYSFLMGAGVFKKLGVIPSKNAAGGYDLNLSAAQYKKFQSFQRVANALARAG